MFCIKRLKYIALFLLLAFIIFGCGKEPDDPVFDNPFDPQNPKTNGEPYHLQVAVGNKNVVNLKWNQIDNVKKFSVYRSSSLDNEYKVIGISTSTEYVDSNIDANVTYNYKIRAYWNGTEASPSGIVSIMPLIIYTITATAESGGSISPSGNVKVAYGSSQSFNISPNSGYSILDVKLDGVSKGNISTYAFSNVITDHTIKAIFEMITQNPDITGMVLIPAGEFQMGDSFNEGADDKLPVHTVYLDAFYIDKSEVTNVQYRKFVQATGHKEPEGNIYVNGSWVWGKPWQDKNYNGDNQPVMCVSWNDAKAYADWAGKRLPTEAEWEKSARDGLVGKRYPWGDDISYDNANYWEKGGKDVWTYTSPVGSFAPNGYGLYDIAGNVWEWCSDWYDSNYYANSPKSNPTGPGSGSYRVLRGGSWNFYAYYLRVSYRCLFVPTFTFYGVGFRCVSGLSVAP
jgi:formylglycine-generating enzyme required for sulfatase activity